MFCGAAGECGLALWYLTKNKQVNREKFIITHMNNDEKLFVLW